MDVFKVFKPLNVIKACGLARSLNITKALNDIFKINNHIIHK